MSETPESAKHFIADAPRGAYTTFRTCGGPRVFRLTQHAQRIVDTARAMNPEGDFAGTTLEAIRALMAKITREMLDHLPGPGDIRVYFLLTVFEPEHQVYAFAEPIPSLAERRTEFVLLTAGRDNPGAKDTQWMQARAGMESLIRGPVDEVVMQRGGRISEGLSSNFFALKRGAGGRGVVLETAPEGECLLGTVRSTVLQAARSLGMDVQEVSPGLADLASGGWIGCLVSSTSRVVTPCTRIEVGDGVRAEIPGLAAEYRFELAPELVSLREAVLARLSADSEPIEG